MPIKCQVEAQTRADSRFGFNSETGVLTTATQLFVDRVGANFDFQMCFAMLQTLQCCTD